MKTGSRTAGVEIRSLVKQMPPGQRKLPEHMNTGSWRHPVFDRTRKKPWVTQTVTPPGWFDRPANKGGRKIRDSAVGVVNDINRKIAD